MTLTGSLLSANVLGAAFFVLIASKTWIEPELASTPGASGGAGLVWTMTAVPILLLFVLLDVGVFGWTCIRRIRNGHWVPTLPA